MPFEHFQVWWFHHFPSSLFQCPTTLSVKKFSLISNLNLTWCKLGCWSTHTLKWRRVAHPLLSHKDSPWVHARAVPCLGWQWACGPQMPSAGGGHWCCCWGAHHQAGCLSFSGSLPIFYMAGLPAWCSSKTHQSSETPLRISPANPESSWSLPLLPNQSKLGSPRMGLPGVDKPPTCSLTAGNCKPPCRETLCWKAIPNL